LYNANFVWLLGHVTGSPKVKKPTMTERQRNLMKSQQKAGKTFSQLSTKTVVTIKMSIYVTGYINTSVACRRRCQC